LKTKADNCKFTRLIPPPKGSGFPPIRIGSDFYEKNPRKNDSAVEYVANSIKEFGFKVPCVIDKNDVIVCGHTRVKAAERLGIKEIPCIIADDLTDEQIKMFRIADNSVASKSQWDFDLLREEVLELPTFELPDFNINIPEERDWFGDERERTIKNTNLEFFTEENCKGKYDMPVIHAVDHVPKDLIAFNYMLTSDKYDCGIHFYIDDYQFERLWNTPRKYMDKISKFDCCLTPDFSLYLDMPIAMQIWNVYRSRLIGQIMQDNCITVIPTLSWSTPESYEFCFDGIESGSVVSVSTTGVKQSKEAKDIWFDGMNEAIKRLDPSHVVVYGGDIGYKFKCDVSYIDNTTVARMRGKK
jgi:hypothetical protein